MCCFCLPVALSQVLRTNGDNSVHFEILSNPEFLAEGEPLQPAVKHTAPSW
jgi:hypothetical protein